MAVEIKTLLSSLEELLTPNEFNDYCPNGLQVEGCSSVSKLITGVTASQALINSAIDQQADAILVHHGYFWNGESPSIVGMKYRRIKALIDNDINLIAYHLPLDAHPMLGNNAKLAELLGISITGGLDPNNSHSVGNVGVFPEAIEAETFSLQIEKILGRKPLLVAAGEHKIKTIAWCTGSAQGYIERAAVLGVDAYLSGEVSEHTVHSARELGVHYIAAGHHATERYGVQAVGEYMAKKFGLDHQFIDIDNPA
jgi:dinuclear metal center YbgI/SA1388 family protein